MLVRLFLTIGITLASASLAAACTCGSRPNPDYNTAIGATDVIADIVVERLRPYKRHWQIATVRVTKSWKGTVEGARLEVAFGDQDSCSTGIPAIGSSFKNYMMRRDSKNQFEWIGPCTTHAPPNELQLYESERAVRKSRALAQPHDLASQLAFARFLNLYGDSKDLLSFVETEPESIRNAPLMQIERAEALSALDRKDDARAAIEAAWKSGTPTESARASFVNTHIGARAEMRLLLKKVGRAVFGAALRPGLSYGSVLGDMSEVRLENIRATSSTWAPGSQWQRARLRHVEFDRINFSHADLSDAYFDDVKFHNSDLSHVQASGLRCGVCDFGGATMRGLNAPKAAIQGTFVGADLKGANLDGARLRSTVFTGADLSGASLRSADLNGVLMKRALLAGADLTDARMTNADISGADLSSAILSKGNLTFARMDCDTRLPGDFDAAAEPVIPMARCPGSKPAVIDGSAYRDRYIYPNWTDAVLDDATIANLGGSFIRTNLDRASFTSNRSIPTNLTDVSARESRFESYEGGLSISSSDLTGATITGSSEKPIQVQISLEALGTMRTTKLDNASFTHVDLRLISSAADRFVEPRLSTTGLQLRNARLSCFDSAKLLSRVTGEPAAGYKARYEGAIRNLVAELALVRNLAALDPSNSIVPECAKIVETYLAGNCKAGNAKAGFAYACPAAVAPR